MQTNERQKRRAWVACAALGVALTGVAWGCLNPRPDDDPSVVVDEGVGPPSGEDFCSSNPSSQDCDDTDGNEVDLSGGTDSEPRPTDEPNNEEPSGGTLDPNADAGTKDAGAPDASADASD